jgi:flagellum-specific ATP synthase
MFLNNLQKKISDINVDNEIKAHGEVSKLSGLMIEAKGLHVPVGFICFTETMHHKKIELEVVGFSKEVTYLMPRESVEGILPGSPVWSSGFPKRFPIGEGLLGRVVNGLGSPIDGLGDLTQVELFAEEVEVINPLSRNIIQDPLNVGVKAINALLTIGVGQRIGLMAGSGVGKSVLLGMISRFTSADIVVVGLIGERGREIKEFIEKNLGKSGLKKSCVVASPADSPALQRINATHYATQIAEFFRSQGKNVLLVIDSLTRYAQSLREIALSLGEVPAARGYPPSVFTKIPAIVERAGFSGDNKGSITAIYTVLAEGDDNQDPIVDASRAILDGHIVLSRTLSENGHYPAIDIERSLSRCMQDIIASEHWQAALKIKQLYSRFQKYQELIMIGAYASGTDPILDEAMLKMPLINSMLRQSMEESFNLNQSIQILKDI